MFSPYICVPAVLSLSQNRAGYFQLKKEKLRATTIFAKTGRGVFIFELVLGGGSLGYVNSILYFYFLFPSRFALNFSFKVRYTFFRVCSILEYYFCGYLWQ